MRTPTLLLAAGAAALLLAACTDEQTLDDFLDPVEESDDDTPDNADDDADDDSASDDGDGGGLEVDTDAVARAEVTAAFAALVDAADEYDFGTISFDELAGLLTPAAAEQADGSWEPWPIGDDVSGRREVSGDPEIDLSDDGSYATVVDCVWDRRLTTGQDEWGDGNYPPELLPFGVTHRVEAAFRLTDDGWLAESFRDPFTEEDVWSPCLPPDMKDEVLDAAAEAREASWDAVTIKWAPEFDGQQLPRESYESSQLHRDAFRDSQSEAVMDFRYRLNLEEHTGVVGPVSTLVGICWEQDRYEGFDPDTGELGGDDNGAQYRSAFWMVRDTPDDDWFVQSIISSERAARNGYGVCEDLDRQWDSGNLDRYVQP